MNQWSWNITQNIKNITSSRCPPLRCSHSASRLRSLLMALRNTSTRIHEISSCICSFSCWVMWGAFSQSQFLGMMHSWSARTLFEWCSHSVNVLWGANCFNTTIFLLNSWAGLFKVAYPRLYGMSWWHFTVSKNPEFLAKFTLGGNVAIVFLWNYFTAKGRCAPVRDSISYWRLFTATPPGSVFPPYPLTLKIEKTLLPHRPIQWRTLYMVR